MCLLYGTIANKPKTLKKLMQMIHTSIEAKLVTPVFTQDKAEITTIQSDEEKVSDIISKAERIAKEVCTYTDSKYNLRTRKIDKILTSKKFGIPIMIAFLTLIFWITITGANYPSSLLSTFFGFIQDKLLTLFTNIHAPEFLTNILIYRNVPDSNLGCGRNATSYGNILPTVYIA